MKIGIIVYSQTGNTYSVAQKLRERLLTAGHLVNIERIIPVGGEQRDVKKIRIEKLPDIGTYDALIFAAPVHGFTLSPVMASYMKQLPPLGNKKIACFVTMFFPFSWMGGLNAIAGMKRFCESMNGKVLRTGIVNWSRKDREKKISDMVEELSRLF